MEVLQNPFHLPWLAWPEARPPAGSARGSGPEKGFHRLELGRSISWSWCEPPSAERGLRCPPRHRSGSLSLSVKISISFGNFSGMVLAAHASFPMHFLPRQSCPDGNEYRPNMQSIGGLKQRPENEVPAARPSELLNEFQLKFLNHRIDVWIFHKIAPEQFWSDGFQS